MVPSHHNINSNSNSAGDSDMNSLRLRLGLPLGLGLGLSDIAISSSDGARLFLMASAAHLIRGYYSQHVRACREPIVEGSSWVAFPFHFGSPSESESVPPSSSSCQCPPGEPPQGPQGSAELDQLTHLNESLHAIVRANPYIPPLFTLFDIHGQLQTTTQFMIRHFFIIMGRVARLLPFPFAAYFGLDHSSLTYRRELFGLADGGLIALDWASLKCPDYRPAAMSDATVIIYHGLGGSSRAEYVIYAATQLLRAGLRVVVMNARGCGGVPLMNRTTYVGDKTQDIKEVVKHVHGALNRPNKPKHKVFLLGFSLGAASTLRYLTRDDVLSADGGCELTAAAAISPPWNVAKQTSVFPLWSYFLVLPLKAYIYRHQRALRRDDVSINQVLACLTLEQMDLMLVQHYGYKDTAEYHRHISPATTAHLLRLPTLVVSARDDPVCCVDGMPPHAMRGPGLFVVKTRCGGHLGFPSGDFPYSRAWPDQVVVDWFKLFLEDS